MMTQSAPSFLRGRLLATLLCAVLFTASAQSQTPLPETVPAPQTAPATPTAPAPPAERFFESGGFTLRYVEAGQGDLVILLHGFGANADLNWVRPGVMMKLSRDFRVVALDCRGHGKSGKPYLTSKYGQKMAHDIANLLDHLQAPKGHIVGYSMGGVIAAKFATLYPDRVSTLTLGGTAGRRKTTEQDARDDETLASSLEEGKGFGPLLVRLRPPNEPGLSDAAIAQASNALLSRNDPRALAALVRGLSENVVSDEQFKTIRAPMMAIVGTADPNLRNVEALKELLSDLRVVTIEGATHVGAPRGAPVRPQFVTAIREFISVHPSRAENDDCPLRPDGVARLRDIPRDRGRRSHRSVGALQAELRGVPRQSRGAGAPFTNFESVVAGRHPRRADERNDGPSGEGPQCGREAGACGYRGTPTPAPASGGTAAGPSDPPARHAPVCANSPLGDPSTGPRWSGWSADPENARFQREPGLRVRRAEPQTEMGVRISPAARRPTATRRSSPAVSSSAATTAPSTRSTRRPAAPIGRSRRTAACAALRASARRRATATRSTSAI